MELSSQQDEQRVAHALLRISASQDERLSTVSRLIFLSPGRTSPKRRVRPFTRCAGPQCVEGGRHCARRSPESDDTRSTSTRACSGEPAQEAARLATPRPQHRATPRHFHHRHRHGKLVFKAVAINVMGIAGIRYGVEDDDRAADTEHSVAKEHSDRGWPPAHDLVQRRLQIGFLDGFKAAPPFARQ